MSEYGHIIWPNNQERIWEFNYALEGTPAEEGIAIKNAYYRGKEVFFKASLPALRVQYDNNYTGPYKDPLNYNNAQFYPSGSANKVWQYGYSSFGLRALVLESFHQIGWYKLKCRWIFFEDGRVAPRLYSSGIIEHKNHRHHAYWRFDFDVTGAGNDLALEYNNYTPDIGWGPGWHMKSNEITRVKNPASNRTWAIMDKATGRGYMIRTGANDGVADSYSQSDFWVTRYHWNEDKNGRQGDAHDDHLHDYLNFENANGQDLVLWYCSHLYHNAEHDSGDEWHSAGPDLIPFRY